MPQCFKFRMHDGRSCGRTTLINSRIPLHLFATPFFPWRCALLLVTLADDRHGL